MNPECIQALDFSTPEILNAINRKTQFTQDEEGTLTGNRPVGFLDITFNIDVNMERNETTTSVKQHLYNYNMFVDSADFQFRLTPQSDELTLVDLTASNRVSDNIPDWISHMFQSDVSDKVVYFQSALNRLCYTL